MAQEFTIKSTNIEDKINQLLPSQGGAGAGVDFSASTMVIPVVDLTETAEGSILREDLQRSFSFKSITSFSVTSGGQNILNTTGYYRVFGQFNLNAGSTARSCTIVLTDGSTNKNVLLNEQLAASFGAIPSILFDFVVKLEAGDSLNGFVSANATIRGCTRQIADLQGNLINP